MPIPNKTFDYRAGDTPMPLRCRLRSRDVRSGALQARPVAGDVVEWTISWPGAEETKTSAPGGGLRVDPRTKVVTHPIDPARIASLSAGARVPLVVRVVNAAGERRTWFTGTIVKEGVQA